MKRFVSDTCIYSCSKLGGGKRLKEDVLLLKVLVTLQGGYKPYQYIVLSVIVQTLVLRTRQVTVDTEKAKS